MEKKIANKILISSPSIADTETLFGVFLAVPGNANKSYDSFMDFISVESVDRELFLNEYCKYEFMEVQDSIVLKFEMK